MPMRVMVAQKASDESVSVEGPLKLTEDSNERVFSAMMEYSSRSNWMIMFIRLQAALEVLWEVEARDARSHTWCQYLFKEGSFAFELLAMLYCTARLAMVCKAVEQIPTLR